MRRGVYRHHKGNEYVVLGTVVNASNGMNDETMVLYTSVENFKGFDMNIDCKVFCRNLYEFNEKIINPNYRNGGHFRVSRFEYVGDMVERLRRVQVDA